MRRRPHDRKLEFGAVSELKAKVAYMFAVYLHLGGLRMASRNGMGLMAFFASVATVAALWAAWVALPKYSRSQQQ